MEDDDAEKWVGEETSCFSEKRSRRVARSLWVDTELDVIMRILTVYLRKYTQSMVALLYTGESLPVLGLWVWLGGIRPTRCKLDTLEWSY